MKDTEVIAEGENWRVTVVAHGSEIQAIFQVAEQSFSLARVPTSDDEAKHHCTFIATMFSQALKRMLP